MIEIKFTGMCEGCQNADLEAHSLRTNTGYKWIVTCSHNEACERMMAKMEAEDFRQDPSNRGCIFVEAH